ncbi:glycosyltransferase family 4 protein [Anaerotalea alkaliphila]|uniref:Glycosyltransferase family 4 protein n=1 Tax=Anaerotalea alkaliphila TaxID=2662126 RepID=A0A7X5HWY3_9FIRM|nr:glycosyltransferase family 4 protein [Anaerotalea alkaliphila]NDL68195.1 glycosyltransferase family 4 protein [Anaerotalea alkaliphila]
MNIGIFTDCYYPQINGVVTSVMILRDELVKRGHKVTIITVKVPGHQDEEEDIIRIPSLPFARWKEFRVAVPLFARAYRRVKKLDLDVIHTHTEFSIGLFGKYMARALSIPVLHTYHTMYEDYTHYVLNFKPGKRVVKKLIIRGSKVYVKKFNALIAPSAKTKEALERYGVKNRIFVLPTGINIQNFQRTSPDHPRIQEIRRQLGLTPENRVILSLGRVSEEKNVQLTLRQFAFLQKTHPHVRLVVVGDGPYREKLVQLHRELGLEDVVRFTGSVPWEEVSYYYSMADLFVSASSTETQGLTILEAMASRLPVVVFEDENIRDVVVHGLSGHLFQDGEGLLKALGSALDNQEFTSHMADNAYAIVQSMSKEHFGESALQIYKTLIDEYASRNTCTLEE